MRMTDYEFVGKFVTHVCDVKLSFLISNPGIEAHMQKHVAQFLAYIRHIVLHQSVGKFECLLDGVGPQTLVGLFLVPRTILP